MLLVLSALFAGSETALTTASRGRLHASPTAASPARRARWRSSEDKERLVGAVLFGSTLANVLAAVARHRCSSPACSATAAWRSPSWR